MARTLHRLGFDAISQDEFSTGHGELRQWLREQIDGCEGLIQLIGQGYGAEPPDVDPQYGRISYTQFEFLYAQQTDIKTWVIVIEDGFERDKAIHQLDLPREQGHSDPAEHQAICRTLQQQYFKRLKKDNHLRHSAKNPTELENLVLRLPDHLKELWQKEEARLRQDAAFQIETTDRLKDLQAAGRLTTEKIRTHLRQTVEETYRREVTEAEKERDWRKRQTQREAADQAHAASLERIEKLLTSIAEIEGRGTGSSVFQELSRILAEQGVDEALAYMETQRSPILQSVRARAAAARARNRADLQPLLHTAALLETTGQEGEARGLYTEILDVEPDWPEALHQAFWFFTGQGDLARIRTTLVEANREYDHAYQIVQHLLGGDPSNTQWQRDLFVSHWKLADVAERQDDPNRANGHWQAAFDALAGIDRRGLHLSPEDRKCLEILRGKI